MNAELIRRGLAAQRRGTIGWSIALLVLTFTSLSVWPAMKELGGLDALVEGLPSEFLAAFGVDDYASATGFLNGQLYAMLLPLLLSVMAIMQMNALTASDEDAGRLELLLALPVSRVSVYLSRFTAVAISVAFVSLLVDLSVRFGGPLFDMHLDHTGVLAATVSVALFALFHAALVLALAGVGLRGAVVLAVAFAVLIFSYVVYAIFPLSDQLAGLAEFSPWHWALGSDPLANGFDWPALALLIGGIVAFIVVAMLGIRRRSIRTA